MNSQLRTIVASTLFVFSFNAFAKPKIHLGTDREIFLNYTSPSWNTDSEKVDSAYLFFRDANTGRVVQIQLEETEPDSGRFVGQFSITWADASHISPEVYIPPQETRSKGQGPALQQIAAGKVPRKPIIVKKNEQQQTIIEIFDKREDAEVAWKNYQEELKADKRKLIKPVPGEKDMEAAKLADREKLMKQLAVDATRREEERQRMAASESEKLKTAQTKFEKLPAAEREARQKKAKEAYDQGMVAYGAADYPKSEKKFREAIDLDPSHPAYFFNYGVVQYRQERADEALVSLSLAPDDPKTVNEKKYYMGLIHLKMKEYKEALPVLNDVAASKDPVLGPSAMFYKGVLLFSDEKYEDSKKSFEDVIDMSQDPKLDQMAEDYLEKVSGALAFKRMAELKWNLSGMVGMMYDSNVLLTTDFAQSQGSATKKGDVRLMTAATLEYRPLFTANHEWSVKGTGNLTNSSNAALSTADPWVYTFEAPYSYKGTLWGKGYKFTARPGYEMLYMALTASSPKRDLMNSYYVALDNTLVMHQNWFSTYTFQFRRDTTQLHLGDSGFDTDADNQTANQYSLRSSQIFLLDKSKQEALVASGRPRA